MNVPVPHHMTTSPANYHTPLPPQPTRPLLGPWDTYYAQPEPQQAHIPTENICLYDGCGALLHDPSCSGVRRHLRDCHFRGHPPSSKALVPCRWGGGCRSEPMQWENLGKHIAECHIKSMKRVCAVCGGCFARSDTLKRHSQSGGCAQRARV